ncbi:MAG: hypothetical protein KBT72_12610 [Zhongshania sp.]|nr:hypothetical protein [Zhongshania sp.]
MIPLLNSPSIAEIQWDAFSEDCLAPNATGIAQFWRLTDSNFFVLLDDSLSFCMPKKKVSKEKRHPTSPSMAKNAIDTLRASQVTAREKLACGSNSFPLNPLLAPVLSGAEGLGGRGEYFGKNDRVRKDENSLVPRHTRPRSGIQVSGVNAFI